MLTQSIGTALAHGQFARVPILAGITHDEELIFIAGLGLTVSQGTNIPLAAPLTSSAKYQTDIAHALGVSDTRATAIANEYPLSAYPSAVVAFTLLVSDASFACPALQVDRWTAARGLPTYAYQFNDDNAPVNIVGKSLGLATHGTELPYLFDQPNAPFPAVLTADQQVLAAKMRTAWTNFAASGNPCIAHGALALVRRRVTGAVARAAAAAGRDELRRRAPLRVLGRRMTHLPSPTLHPDSIPNS